MEPVFILGPTASGKHEVAVQIAERLGAEIVSIDSMKVYRGMDIGTAKPSPEAQARVRHHLIDICDPSEVYSAGRFLADARRLVQEATVPLVFVGGTSLYYKAYAYGMFDGVPADAELRGRLMEVVSEKGSPYLHAELERADPAAAQRIHPNDVRRIVRALEVYRKTDRPISAIQTHWTRRSVEGRVFALRRERADLLKRIPFRIYRMMEEGLVDEVRRLLERPWNREACNAVGYREIVGYLNGEYGLEVAREKIRVNTARFAKRQMTWLRSFPEVEWVDADSDKEANLLAERIVRMNLKKETYDEGG